MGRQYRRVHELTVIFKKYNNKVHDAQIIKGKISVEN
jgi:hypothetical protein